MTEEEKERISRVEILIRIKRLLAGMSGLEPAEVKAGQYLAKDPLNYTSVSKLAMRLWPEEVFSSAIGKRLIFDAEYLQLWEFAGDLGDRDYFEASLSYLLDPAGHFRLQTKYGNGDATQALENEESWTIGLGVLY